MKKLNIEQSIRNTIANDTPDLFDKIIASPYKKLESEDYIVKARPVSNHRRRFRSIAAVCTSMVLFIVLSLGFIQTYPVYANDSVVYIDINPSFKIVTNISGKVTKLEGANSEGKHVVATVSYKNKNYQTVLTQLLQVAKDQGYITPDKENVVLVSVKSNNNKRGDTIKTNSVTDIENKLSTDNISVVVYSQKLEESSQVDQLAKKYNISDGKVQFILNMINQDPSLSIESLASLSVQELEALTLSNNIDLAGIVDCSKQPSNQLASDSTTAADTSIATTATDDIVEPKASTATDAEDTSANETSVAPTNSSASSASTATSNTEPATNGENAVPKTEAANPDGTTGSNAEKPDKGNNNTGEVAIIEEEDEEIVEVKSTEEVIIVPPVGDEDLTIKE